MRNQKPPTTTTQDGQLINITIKSMMQSVDKIVIPVRKDATVGDLKNSCRGKIDIGSSRQALMFNNVELKDDSKHLVEYGIIEDCEVHLHLKMQAGTRDTNPSAEVILIIPNVFSTGDIRESIKNMHMTLPVKPPSQAQRLQATQQAKRDSQWSPEKQMEHELTRNRMKELMKRRRKANAHSSATPDSGSICGSFAQSPAESDPGTPQEFAPAPPKPVKDNSSGRESIVEPKIVAVTEKELKMYYDPPETKRQFEMMRRDLYDPPQSRAELAKVKDELNKMQTTACGLCRRRLSAVQQTAKCLCGKCFCSRHRTPDKHQCSVDYKQTGRAKLQKENPKIDEGGARKAKLKD